jgi:hypothetical protein
VLVRARGSHGYPEPHPARQAHPCTDINKLLEGPPRQYLDPLLSTQQTPARFPCCQLHQDCMYFIVRTRQHMYTAHDARSHTYNRMSPTHVYVNIPNTNTRACLARIPTFIRVHNAIVYTMHKCMHSCKQAMYCPHVSVWSVELWASAAAMCCAPSSPMRLL